MKEHWRGKNYVKPFKLWGNLYFVGTEPASVHIIDTGDGLIMLDTGYQQSLYLVVHNMYLLGFKPEDLKYIVLTHGHIDHIGGARSLREISGAKIALGRPDREYVNGENDLTYAREYDMIFYETFEPDILLDDGDKIYLGNTEITAVATPGHTPGAMSYFFDVYDGDRCFRAGLHGGMGINTMLDEYLDKYNLPHSLRDDFCKAMKRLNEQHVDIFLGNHMQHNDTLGKYEHLINGETDAFVNPEEWAPYNDWCIENLKNGVECK